MEHAWSIKFKYLLSSLFPEEFKLQVYDKNAFQRYLNQSSMICAHGIVFDRIRFWTYRPFCIHGKKIMSTFSLVIISLQISYVLLYILELIRVFMRISKWPPKREVFCYLQSLCIELNIGLLERRSKRSITNYIDLVNELASDIGNDVWMTLNAFYSLASLYLFVCRIPHSLPANVVLLKPWYHHCYLW